MEDLFKRCGNLSELDVSDWDVSNVITMKDLFAQCKNIKKISCENWDVSNVVCMSGIFNFCEKLDVDLSEWDMSNVKYADGMFSACKKFTGKGLENWNVEYLESAVAMFSGSDAQFDISLWNPKNLKKMNFMLTNTKLKAPSWYSRKI